VKERLTLVLFWALVLHVLIAVTFIIEPPFLRGNRLAIVYKKYLLPGPFFKDSQIIDNHSLILSWKINGAWGVPINVSNEDFARYHARLNPSDLYRGRLSYMLLLKLAKADSSVSSFKNKRGFNQLKQFLYDHYVPDEADSVSVRIINNQAENFMVRTDSVYITFAR